MQCSETGSHQAIHVDMPVDLVREIGSLLNSIRGLGGNGRIVLDVQGGNVTGTEVTVKRKSLSSGLESRKQTA